LWLPRGGQPPRALLDALRQRDVRAREAYDGPAVMAALASEPFAVLILVEPWALRDRERLIVAVKRYYPAVAIRICEQRGGIHLRPLGPPATDEASAGGSAPAAREPAEVSKPKTEFAAAETGPGPPEEAAPSRGTDQPERAPTHSPSDGKEAELTEAELATLTAAAETPGAGADQGEPPRAPEPPTTERSPQRLADAAEAAALDVLDELRDETADQTPAAPQAQEGADRRADDEDDFSFEDEDDDFQPPSLTDDELAMLLEDDEPSEGERG
jgi:hypothetical protein